MQVKCEEAVLSRYFDVFEHQQGRHKQWEVHSRTAHGNMNIALGFAYSRRFIMQCLILIKKVQVYIIHKLIYCGWVCVCVCVCVWTWVTDWDAPLLRAIQPDKALYFFFLFFFLFFSTGHILTISPTVKRICPSTGEYIMHADPPHHPPILIWME